MADNLVRAYMSLFRKVEKIEKTSAPVIYCSHLYAHGVRSDANFQNTDTRIQPQKFTKSRVSELSKTQIPNQLCVICYCQSSERKIFEQTKCNHYFHKDCINRWKSISESCPICRQSIK